MDSEGETLEKVNVLLVDDREDGLLALKLVLESPDYNLVQARSGIEALSLLPTLRREVEIRTNPVRTVLGTFRRVLGVS